MNTLTAQLPDLPLLHTALGRALLAGDINGTLDAIDAMSADEKAQTHPDLEALIGPRWQLLRRRTPDGQGWNEGLTKEQANRLFRAIDLAHFMCGNEHPMCEYWRHIGIQDIAAFAKRYHPPHDENVRKHLREMHYGAIIHRLVVAGLVPRPDSDEYLDSLFFNSMGHESNVVLKHVDADPELAPLLLRLFDREGPSDASFSAAEKYCFNPELGWSAAFLTLCERGVYSRAQLLDKTLDALSCDWPQFKSGWFSRFHAQLAPSLDEILPRTERYLALCHSRIAPTVTLALGVVTQLHSAGVLQQDLLFTALEPVMNSATKAHVLAGLSLLTQAVNHNPSAAHTASAVAVQALAHSAADVQKKTLVCLQRWGMDADTQLAASAHLPLLAATNQSTLCTLLGKVPTDPTESATGTQAPRVTAQFTPPQAAVGPLDASRAIAPITTGPDAVDGLAYALENPVDIEMWERVADALVRMAPVPAEHKASFAALHKRAQRLTWNEKPLSFALAQLMACALGATVLPDRFVPIDNKDSDCDDPQVLRTSHDFVAWRTRSLLRLTAHGKGLGPLSTPTHRGGVVAPEQLQTRLAAYAQAGIAPDADDLALAHMRAPDGGGQVQAHSPVLTWSVQEIPGEFVHHDLCIQAEPITLKTLDTNTALTIKHLPEGRWPSEWDAPCIRFLSSLRPGHLDAFYAEGAHALGNNLDWWEAQWQNRAYLDVLLESTAALPPMGTLMVAVSLAGKEPGQTALAVDAAAQCLLQARVTPQALGDTLAQLWATPLLKGPRLAKSLQAVAQAHPGLPLAVYLIVCAVVVVEPKAPRKDAAPLLELMLEIQLTHHLCLPNPVREVLGNQPLTGKAKTAAKALLA